MLSVGLEMGKTHEALKNAEIDYRKHVPRDSRGLLPEKAAPPKRTLTSPSKDVFGDLKANLLNWNSSGSIKSILFICTSHRDGSYMHAANFAAALTEDLNLRVLLVDLNLWTLSFQEVFKIDEALCLFDLFDNSGGMASKIIKAGPGNLYTVRWGANHAEPVKLFESSRFVQFLKMMGKKFDYIILNTPQVTSFLECRALCARVDGVVLVLKDGKTGRQVVLRAKTQLERKVGNKLLGVVLDRKSAFPHQFALIASIVVAVCLVFTAGLFLGNSWMILQEDRSIAANNAVRVNIKHQPKRVAQSLAHAQPDQYPQPTILEEVISSNVSEEEQYSQLTTLEEVTLSNVSKKEDESETITEGAKGAPLERDKPEAKPIQIVVVKRGDTLTRIIDRTYGKYDKGILGTVLHVNPEIQDPDQISVGQAIKLPLLVNNQ